MSPSDPLTEAITAGVATTCAKLSTYPFDLLKTRMATSNQNKNLWKFIVHVYETDGISGFYEGSKPKVFKSVTGKVLYFYIYRLLSEFAVGSSKRNLTTEENLLIGFLSEVLELPVIMPLEAIATKSQVMKNAKFFEVAEELWREGRLYVSLDAYVLGAFQPAIQNTIFDQIKFKINRPLTLLESFSLGVLASSIAITVTYPLDFARTINQASKKEVFNMVIAGAPGSGKGTQCELISKKLGLVHLSTGDILRAAVKSGSQIGLLAKEAMNSGKLVSDDIVIGCIKERIQQPDVMDKGFLLDGFPRTLEQADALSKIAKISVYIHLNVEDSVLLERVIGRRVDEQTNQVYHLKFKPPPKEIENRLIQRDDDTKEKLLVRLEAFHKYSKPILSKYSDCSYVIDGNRAPNEVWNDIENILKEKQRGLQGTMLKIWYFTLKQSGFFGLFKGLSANLTQGVLSAALMLMVKEKLSLFVARLMNRVYSTFSKVVN